MVSWSDRALDNINGDKLDRRRLIDSLAGLLSGDGLDTPLVVGVYGDWGSGKTTVMQMLRSKLEPKQQGDQHEADKKQSKTLCLWFDAWKFARSEHSLWRALLLAVIDELGEKLPEKLPQKIVVNDKEEELTQEKLKEDLNELRERLFRSLTIKEKGNLQVNWSEALPFTVDVGIRLMTAGLGDKLGISDWITSLFGDETKKISNEDAEKAVKLIERTYAEHYRAQITAIDQFEDALSTLIEKYLARTGHRLTVFVDDLDRCLPEDAIAALEAIKLFFDIEGCVFVLGMDRDVVERGILSRFPPIETATGDDDKTVHIERVDPRKYLDKIVQIPMALPPLTADQVGIYLDDLFSRDGVDARLVQCDDLIKTAAPPNPRTLKRVLNVLALQVPIRGGDDDEARRLAKVILMQVVFDDAYQLLRKDPLLIKQFEQGAGGHNAGIREDVRDILAANQPLKDLMKLDPKFGGCDDGYIIGLIAQAEVTSGSAS